MLTELFPHCLSISVGQMSPDNGLAHVSREVGIEDTKHEGLFSLKKLSFFRFTAWSIGGIQEVLATMNRLLLKPSKYLLSFREGYAAIPLLIPFSKPINSIAACQYPVGLDEHMGPERTGSGPMRFGRCWIKSVLNMVEVC